VLAGKAICAVLRSVIDKKVTSIEILVVGEDQALVRRRAEIPLNPKELV